MAGSSEGNRDDFGPDDRLEEWFEELPAEIRPGLKKRGRPSLTAGADAQLSLPSEPVAEVESRFDREEVELVGLMAPIVAQVNAILSGYKNRTLGSFESNGVAVERINRLADCFGLVLLYDKKPIRLRCFKAPGSKAGQIQARLNGRSATPVWSRNVFPPLEAVPRSSIGKSTPAP